MGNESRLFQSPEGKGLLEDLGVWEDNVKMQLKGITGIGLVLSGSDTDQWLASVKHDNGLTDCKYVGEFVE